MNVHKPLPLPLKRTFQYEKEKKLKANVSLKQLVKISVKRVALGVAPRSQLHRIIS